MAKKAQRGKNSIERKLIMIELQKQHQSIGRPRFTRGTCNKKSCRSTPSCISDMYEISPYVNLCQIMVIFLKLSAIVPWRWGDIESIWFHLPLVNWGRPIDWCCFWSSIIISLRSMEFLPLWAFFAIRGVWDYSRNSGTIRATRSIHTSFDGELSI